LLTQILAATFRCAKADQPWGTETRFAGSCFAVSGRKSRKETIFLPARKRASRKIAPPPAYTPPGTIEHEGAAAPSNYPVGFGGLRPSGPPEGLAAAQERDAEGCGLPDLPRGLAAAQERIPDCRKGFRTFDTFPVAAIHDETRA